MASEAVGLRIPQISQVHFVRSSIHVFVLLLVRAGVLLAA